MQQEAAGPYGLAALLLGSGLQNTPALSHPQWTQFAVRHAQRMEVLNGLDHCFTRHHFARFALLHL
jgi:hypothetical protein